MSDKDKDEMEEKKQESAVTGIPTKNLLKTDYQDKMYDFYSKRRCDETIILHENAVKFSSVSAREYLHFDGPRDQLLAQECSSMEDDNTMPMRSDSKMTDEFFNWADSFSMDWFNWIFEIKYKFKLLASS